MSNINKYFPLPLVVQFLNGRMWKLIAPFEYHPDKGDVIKIFVNFTFDFASIPKLFWSFIGHPAGKYGPAALLHDFLYYKKIYARRKADKIFLVAMKALKVSFWKRQIMYYAVRLGGRKAWNKHRKI
ncbi:hypothetical protein LCGC14_0398810 [marine sediment metagenome]|uniref:DUF1353 domain-containing protein n=1 Tax=marine sediment metagenome TaxID=412755 RepID=A0A0F9SXB4_9ZZZZ|nr:DUF1353 domain-containing protein [Candidatus Aminicenantes bacterium]